MLILFLDNILKCFMLPYKQLFPNIQIYTSKVLNEIIYFIWNIWLVLPSTLTLTISRRDLHDFMWRTCAWWHSPDHRGLQVSFFSFGCFSSALPDMPWLMCFSFSLIKWMLCLAGQGFFFFFSRWLKHNSFLVQSLSLNS